MKSRIIKIGNKNVGDTNSCYTIAEAGANHDGNVEKAFKLIDAAIKAKSDSIKFQTYSAEKLVTKSAPKYWEDGIDNETQFDVFKKLDSLSKENWKSVFEYAAKKEITCFSTPFDETSVDLLYSFNVPAFKIASADITHIPLIKHVASKKLPIFISTGMASEEDIEDAVNTIEDEGNHDIIIMHCITSYPTQPKDANLQMIKTLQEKFHDYIITPSYYFDSVSKYVKLFGRNQTKICIYEEFASNTEKIVAEILDFLGVDVSLPKNISKKYNDFAHPLGKSQNFFMKSSVSKNIGRRLLSQSTRLSIKNFLSDKNSKPKLKENDILKLHEFFVNDVTKIQDLLQRKLQWQHFSNTF